MSKQKKLTDAMQGRWQQATLLQGLYMPVFKQAHEV